MQLTLPLEEHRFLWATLVVALLLLMLHVLLHMAVYLDYEVHWLIIQLFDLDDENNLPTWFSSFLLLSAASALHARPGADGGGVASTDMLHFRVLAAGFFLLSIDEVAGLHESLNTAIEMNWAIPGAVLVSLVGLWYLPFLIRQPARLRWMMVLSGSLYVSGAVGVELLSADMDEDSFHYELAVAVEEGLEMLGVWLFLRTILLNRAGVPD